ncbi:MAG: helix-turn-helix domain-containing protein [Phormidium sp.]
MPSTELFTEAANEWDLETLYTDLASAKGKRLTPVEKLHLRGLLCGYSPAELAEKLNKSAKGIGVDLCNTLYHYVKNLVGKGDEKIENWRNIAEWLEEAGYKSQSSAEYETSDCLPLEFLIKRANITIDKHKVIVDINLRIVASSPLENPPRIDEIDTNGKV